MKGRPTWNRGVYDGLIHDGYPTNRLKEVLAEDIKKDGLDINDYKVKGWPIRWFDPKASFSSPNILLVGDAAGVDPTYGEGISFALGYGRFAAFELKEAFEKVDFSFVGYRNRILKDPMGTCLKRRLRTAKMLYAVRSRTVHRILWWRFGFLMRWYIENQLVNWASKLPDTMKKPAKPEENIGKLEPSYCHTSHQRFKL